MIGTRRRFLTLALGAAAGVGIGGAAWLRTRGPSRHSHRRNSRALGTEVSIEAFHSDETLARQAVDEAFAEIERVEAVMSLYRPESQLSRLNAMGRLVDPDPMLVEVLSYARNLAERTDGAFDVTVQPLWQVYAAAQKEGRLPAEAAIADAVTRIGWRHVTVDALQIRLQPGMALTLNGLAQGYAADRAASALRRRGVEHALVNAGEIGAVGSRPDGGMWRAGIQHPREPEAYVALAGLKGRCLSTSGDYATTFSDDFRANHLFDPRTGRSPQEFSSVSVAAPTALAADGLSTALFVLGLDRGRALIDSLPDVAALFVLKGGKVLASRGFPMA